MDPPEPRVADVVRLRAGVRRFVRSFGLLAGDRTPCGAPIPLSVAYALVQLLEATRRDQVVTQQDLARGLHIDKSNVTRLCARLARDGFVEQRRAEHDGRARTVSLTPKGRTLAERVERSSLARFTQLLAAIPADAHDLVLSALEALAIAATPAPESP
ncbi:MAG: winged helix-turn-helix transcriptional regulator [Myxococcales bacterium]|nr:winged helix-turn-helix transcriptional regulator [Myxococcales bacterium]